jgi:hypothetical protein
MSKRKFFLITYALSMLIVYSILVMARLFSTVYGSVTDRDIGWILLSDISVQGIFTIIAMGLFLTLVLKDRIIRDFVFPFGMVFSFLVLGINGVLANLDAIWYESMLSLLLFEQNWLAMIFGASVFMFYYKKFKRAR